ncbi:MAG: hypothetical protein HRT91_01485 [Piscirickettsiaceae bacterium]|nr:hypothetical protein [Piscirickettsiaceae bacterium]
MTRLTHLKLNTKKKATAVPNSLLMKKTDESIQINHSNSLRDPGYKIGIVLPSEITSTEVTLKNRIINFSNFHYINKLESSVDQGMIADR